jgi:RHS repeat-associated core domain
MIWGPTPDELNARNAPAIGGWSFFHREPINSIDVAIDIGGNVVERYLYDPFGKPDIRDANWNTRSSSIITTPYLFTGQEWMADLGLANYKNRFYSPTLGRFLQNDPIRFDGGDLNLYRYCANISINLSAPQGRFAIQALAAVVGGAINPYENYEAYCLGKMSATDYAIYIGTGACYGVLATVAPGVGTAIIFSGATAAANSATNNLLKGESIDVDKAMISAPQVSSDLAR